MGRPDTGRSEATITMAPNPKRGASLPPLGTVLADRYQLLHPIGEGGMSTVYLAEHIAIGRKLAIKILVPEYRDNREVLDRFLQEARAVSLIRHEHIVDITDIGRTSEGLAFLAMEYLEGEDLSTTLLREGRLPWMRLRRMVLQICRALHAAHRKGVVHRDIKPENCFRIKRGGNHDFIKILDFGIAKFIADEGSGRSRRPRMQSGDNVMLGTPEYMAPELARGETPSGSADVYSLGAMMYHALVGRPPFVGDTAAEVLSMQMRDQPVPPRQMAPEAEIPASIERIVLRAMAKNPVERFASVRELTEAIIHADARLSRVTRTQMPAIPDDRTVLLDPRANGHRASRAVEKPDADVEEVLDPDEAFDIRTRAHADEDTVIFFNPALAAKQAASDKGDLPQVHAQLRRYQIGSAILACACFICFGIGWLTAPGPGPSPTLASASPEPSGPPKSPVSIPPDLPAPDPAPTGSPESETSTGAPESEASTQNKPDVNSDDVSDDMAPVQTETTGEVPAPELELVSNQDKQALVAALKQPVQNCARFERIKKGTKLNIKLVVAAKSGTLRATVPPIYQGRLFENCVKKAASKARTKRGYKAAIVWGRYHAP